VRQTNRTPREASVDEVELLEWFRQLLNSKYGLRKDAVMPTADFLNDLGLDSLDEMNLLFDVEEEFDLVIFMGEKADQASYQRVRTVGEAIQFIASRLDDSDR
jgi:acyl carrier protein